MDLRWPRRRLLRTAAAVASGAALAACGPPPPPPVRLAVAGELVPPYLLQSPYSGVHPRVAMSFGPWPPARGASLAALDGPRFGDAATRRGLLPLAARLSLVAFQSTGISPGAWSAFAGGGAQLGVPLAQSRLAVVYDGAALRPAPGWSFADLLSALAAVQASGRQPLADLAGIRVDIWAALVAARGGDVAGAGGLLPQAPSAPALAAWLDVARLSVLAAPGAALAAGGAAVALRFFLLPSDLRALQAGGLKAGVARFPGPAVPARAYGHGIPSAAPEPGAALRFLTWSAEADCQRTLLLQGYVPVVEALATSLPPLPAAAGADPGALLPDAAADSFLPEPLRLSAAAQRAFESALAAARPDDSPATVAAAYAAARAAVGP